MNDKYWNGQSKYRALRRQGFDTEKISTTKNGMKNCGKLRLKWLWNEPTFLSIR